MSIEKQSSNSSVKHESPARNASASQEVSTVEVSSQDESHTPWYRLNRNRRLPVGLKWSVVVHALLGQSYTFLLLSSNLLMPFMLKFVVASYEQRYDTKLSDGGASWLWSITVTSYQVGSVLGALSMRFLMERLGRRDTVMLLSQTFLILSCLLMALSKPVNAFELLIVGRFLFGYGIGTSSWYILVTECAPDKFRGEASTLVALGSYVWILIGTVVALPPLLGSDALWPMYCLVPVLPAAVYMSFTRYFPRSPKFLHISRRRTGDAILAIRFYYGRDADTDDVLREFDREASLMHLSRTASFRQIWTNRHLRFGFVMCMMAAVAQCFSGETIGTAYSNGIYQQVGISQTGSIVLLGLLILVKIILGAFVSIILIERIGRKPLLITGSLFAIVGGIFVFTGDITESEGRVITWSTGVSIVGYLSVVMGDVFGLLAIPSLLVSELNPQATRSLIQAIFATVVQILNLLQTLGFPPLYNAIHSYAFLPSLVLESIALVILWHYLPETKGREIADIVRHLPNDLHWTHHEGAERQERHSERTPLIGNSLTMGADEEILSSVSEPSTSNTSGNNQHRQQ